ncbi:putative tetraacyldisaccharide 4'-kinase, mitochondrial [Drosera capensis]
MVIWGGGGEVGFRYPVENLRFCDVGFGFHVCLVRFEGFWEWEDADGGVLGTLVRCFLDFSSCSIQGRGKADLLGLRGYAGGDEVKMLWRHLRGTSIKIGVGADRVMTAHRSLDRYGHLDPCSGILADNRLTNEKVDNHSDDGRIGVAILDDGMQISEQNLYNIQSTIREMKDPLPVFFTRMAPCYFATVEDIDTRIPLTAAQGKIFLCVSAIGSPDGIVNCIEKASPAYASIS